MRVAQFVKTVRTRDVAGLADSSWFLLAISAGIWGVYGAVTAKWPIVAGALVVAISSLAVTAAARWVRSRGTVSPTATPTVPGS
jgi:uncharacterized protein with PQ loop repeat